jgi:hypothetical protein
LPLELFIGGFGKKRIEAPPVQNVLGMRVRLWAPEDIEKVKQYKVRHYWGKGGRKKRKKRAK